MSLIVGIDLGTTNSACAVLQDGQPVLIPNADGDLLTPSVVSLGDDGVFLVGGAAAPRLTTAPVFTASCFKRDMGTSRSMQLGERVYSPEELSALVLRALRTDAEAFLGHPIEEAVVTVPAYFNEAQRQSTRAAAEIAGLKVERIINEPTAAALAYGLHNLDEEVVAIVLDLGGGTFDVTVLEIIEGVIEIQSSAGDSRLGGEDFVDVMVSECSRRIVDTYGAAPIDEPVPQARLRAGCELAKRRLSSQQETRLALPGLPLTTGETDIDLPLVRADVDSWFDGLLRRLERPIRAALTDANLVPSDIGRVLLVGGATRMPVVRRLAATLFGQLPLDSLPADEAVAMGAAVQAALKEGRAEVEDLVVTDVAPFSLGIATQVRAGGRGVPGLFAPIIERGTVIPCSRVERFSTVVADQTEIRVQVFQGEHSHTRDNTAMGEFRVKVPKGPAGQEEIDVRFTYDLNGLLEVETTVVSTGRVVEFVVEERPGLMSPTRLAAARKAMEGLKTHPRDLLPNRTALHRAEQLHVELRGPDRAALSQAIAWLRGALEGQDPTTIARVREALNALVSALRSSGD